MGSLFSVTDTPSAGLTWPLEGQDTMALAVLSNQGDEVLTINQDTVFASSKRPRAQREGLIGKDHCRLITPGFHPSQCFEDDPLTNPPILATQPTHPLLIASGQQKIYPMMGKLRVWIDLIALGA